MKMLSMLSLAFMVAEAAVVSAQTSSTTFSVSIGWDPESQQRDDIPEEDLLDVPEDNSTEILPCSFNMTDNTTMYMNETMLCQNMTNATVNFGNNQTMSVLRTELPASDSPSVQPSSIPSSAPSRSPTIRPSLRPTNKPTSRPTNKPTSKPTFRPTERPTLPPTTPEPTFAPRPCSLCGDGSSPLKGQKIVITETDGFLFTCEEFGTGIIGSNDITTRIFDPYCKEFDGTLNGIDVASYCECSGTSYAKVCGERLCPVGMPNPHLVYMELTCQQWDNYNQAMVDANACTNLDAQRAFCCDGFSV